MRSLADHVIRINTQKRGVGDDQDQGAQPWSARRSGAPRCHGKWSAALCAPAALLDAPSLVEDALGADHDRDVDHLAVELDRRAALRLGLLVDLDHALRPVDILRTDAEFLVQDFDVVRMNARGTL